MELELIVLKKRKKARVTKGVFVGALAMLSMSGAPLNASDAIPRAAPPSPVHLLLPGERMELEQLLTLEARKLVDMQERMDGQGAIGVPHVTFSKDGYTLIVDLGKGYVPRINGSELEDHLSLIYNGLLSAAEPVAPVRGVEFVFDGKDIFHYFPEDWRPVPVQKRREVSTSTGKIAPLNVLISAGHGLYFHRGYNDWRPARGESNGIVEDFVTPVMASDLASYLNERSAATTRQVRSESQSIHDGSGQSWWKVGSRYHLQHMYPDLSAVWNSKGAEDYPLVERDEDIYSRPFFANYLGVDALLQIHTNADINSSTRGTRVFYQTGRAEDLRLSTSILFYMGESIRAEEGYENYPVAANANPANLAENREAKMASAIVEVGFHSNAADAAALQDPVFRKAAMRGLEKGYRLFLADKPLQKFEVTDHPGVEARPGETVQVKAYFAGYPQFPVKRESSILSCPTGWTCNGSTQSLAETESPFVSVANCNSANIEAGTVRTRVVFTDADGLVTKSEYDLRCTL